MLTKEQVQQAIEVLKRERRAFTHTPMVYVRENPVPEGETRLTPETYYYDDWKPVFDAHPELRDALTLVVMASFPSHQINMPMTPFQRSVSEWIDFYESLPPDVLDTNPPLGLHALIRNLADEIFHKIHDEDGDTIIDPNDGERLVSVSVNRPSLVQAAGLNARVLHDMLFGALAYHALPESERDAMLQRVADAVEQFIDAYGTGAFPKVNGQTFTGIAYPVEFLPIAHVFSRALDDPTTSGIARRYFTDIVGKWLYDPTQYEQSWVYGKFAPLFDEGLRGLFARRDFSRESVLGVLRDGFGVFADSKNTTPLKQILKEILEHRHSTTFYGLMGVLSRAFPEEAMRIARLAANTVSTMDGAEIYARLAQGKAPDTQAVKLVSKSMRDAAKHAFPIVYQRVFRRTKSRSPQTQNRGEFARMTASAVMGIETDHMNHYYPPHVWIDLWEGFHSLLTDPSELLKDPQKLAAYRNAHDRVFSDGLIDDLCKRRANDERQA
jgi:hypothetical protein